MNQLFFYCFGCRDRRPVGTERRYCLCGAVSARTTGDTVMLAGPGDVIADATGPGRDQIRIVRPSPIGT
jgi:hypothetical protein